MSQSPEQTNSLTAQIEAAQTELMRLYAERAGRYDAGHAWCCQCGQNVVDAEGGWDTCATCVVVSRRS